MIRPPTALAECLARIVQQACARPSASASKKTRADVAVVFHYSYNQEFSWTLGFSWTSHASVARAFDSARPAPPLSSLGQFYPLGSPRGQRRPEVQELCLFSWYCCVYWYLQLTSEALSIAAISDSLKVKPCVSASLSHRSLPSLAGPHSNTGSTASSFHIWRLL